MEERGGSYDAAHLRLEVRTILGADVVTRRHFLRTSAAGVLLLGTGALIPAACRRYSSPDKPLLVLNRMEYSVVNAVASQILGIEPSQIGAEGVDVGLFVDRFLADFDLDLRRQVRWMLRVFEHGTHIFDLKRVRFTALSSEERDRYLAGWMDSSIGARRVVFRALKALSALGYYSRPQSWQSIGYDGPWLGRVPVAVTSPPVGLTLEPWSSVTGRLK